MSIDEKMNPHELIEQATDHAGTFGARVAESGEMSPTQIAEAYRAAMLEHKMGFKDAWRIYKAGMFWSVVMSVCIIMESYDTMLVGSFYALPAFQQQFGIRLANGSYQLTAPVQTAFSVVGSIGLIIGVHINGALVQRYGHRRTVLVCLFIIICFVFMLFFAKNIATLILGEFLINIPIGFINNVAPAYAIEVAPMALRHYGPAYVQLCWVFGHLFGSGILNIWVGNHTEWAWRIPYALQWIWPVPLLFLIAIAPDSPWWLARHGRYDEALATLNRLSNGEVDNREALEFMKHTIQLESTLDFGVRYRDLFKGIDLRRTEIACMVWVGQAMTGFALPSGVYFFTVAGLSAKNAFALNVGQFGVVGVGTISGILLCQRFGRRTMWFVSEWGMTACILTIAILAMLPHQTPNIVWPQAVMVLGRYLFYGLGSGILPFVYSTEIGSIALRPKTLALSRNIYNLLSIMSSVVSTWALNPTAWNIKGKAAWFAVGFNILIIVWSYWRLPESKDRSFEELDIMFAKKVPARQFKNYTVSTEEQFGAHASQLSAKLEVDVDAVERKF